jgi:hypothetical protein
MTNIAKDATVVEMKKAKAIHKACSDDYKIWKTGEDGCKKLIRASVEEVYINTLKDGTTFFHEVFAHDLLEHLEKKIYWSPCSQHCHVVLEHTPPLQKCCKHA